MPVDALFAKVKDIIVEDLGLDPDEVTPSSSFEEDLGADSLDRVELTMSIEEAFEIDIPDDHAAKLETVQQLIDYLRANEVTV